MKLCRLLCILSLFLFVCISVGWSVPSKQNHGNTDSGALTFEQRVAYQRAIEEVYWRHRIWPKENKTPKPSLDKFSPDSLIRAKVEDYLKKSNALAEYWQHPIQPEQLQAEINRMIKNTKQPQMLRELFSALGDNPRVIAECLARPALVDRLIHNWYANDERYHGALKQSIEGELRGATVQSIRALSGRYSEIETVQSTQADSPRRGRILNLNESQWKDHVSSVKKLFGQQTIPAGKLSGLQQDADRFYVVTVLETANDRMKTATVEWPKKSFGEWWSIEKDRISTNIIEAPHFYNFSPIPATPSCTDDTWTATSNIGLPEGRIYHTAVWTGSEMIIWGGVGGHNFGEGFRYDPSTDTWNSTNDANAPSRRGLHTAVWTGTEMIVWGGLASDADRSDTGGRYNPSTNSWDPTSTVGVPYGRVGHTAVWTGSEMIIWGSEDSANDGGRYNPSTNSWTLTSLTNPPEKRSYHTAVWTGSEMIVWGGFGETNGYLFSGGRYNPATDSWTATSLSNAPAGRTDHTAVWSGTEMIIWGGDSGSGNILSSGGRYNPTANSWTATSTTNVDALRFHTAVWTGSEMIVWSGQGFSGVRSTGSRYNPSSDSWTATTITNAPLPRTDHTAVWTGSEMIVWGGLVSFDRSATGGRYNPSTDSWVPTKENMPEGRVFHSAVWTGTEMIVWCGLDGQTNLDFSSGARYNPSIDNWVATNLTNAPEARALHAAVWTGMEMIIWGGGTPFTDLSTGGRYIPVSDSWIATSTNNAPVARSSVTGVWTGNEMIVWGGNTNFTYHSTGGRYNPGTDTWVATNNTNAPTERNLHTAVWTDAQMIIWGGKNQNGFFASGSRYDPANDTWSSTSTTNAPSAREAHAGVWTGSKMIVWGGVDLSGYVSSGGLYDPIADSWTETSPSGVDARQLPTAIWTGNEMIVWGGIGQSGYLNTGGRYNPTLDTWSGPTTLNAPTGRALHTAIWTGSEMIVWGGRNDTPDFFNTGGRYCATLAAQTSIFIGNATVIEGNSGTTDLNFPVHLDRVTTQDVTATYVSLDDTATDFDNDYEPENNSITIPAGQTQGTITIHVNGDTKFEAHEDLFVNLTSVTNATMGYDHGVGTIYNDDAPPLISISDASVVEGNSGTVEMSFTVTLSTTSELYTNFRVYTLNEEATDGSDYSGRAGVAYTIPPGQTTRTILIPVNGDTLYEADEDFVVDLSDIENAAIADDQGRGVIINDDPVPSLFISDASMPEQNGGQAPMTFQVLLSAASAFDTTVQYATADSTATASSGDYISASSTLTIPAESTSGTLVVFVNGDTVFEPHETFFVNLSNPTNATISDAQGVGTILNDEPNGPFLSISDVVKKEGKNGVTTSFSFTVTLSVMVASSVSVQYATADGTATVSGNDYVATSGVLTIPAGMKKGTITVQVTGDRTREPNETFFANLSNSLGAVILDPQGMGTIQNDD